MEEKIRVLHFKVGTPPVVKEVNNELKELQQLVGGGLIDIAKVYEDDALVVCNDEGLLLCMPFNRHIKEEHEKTPIFGDFFICQRIGEDFGSLNDEQIEKYKALFYEQYIDEPDIGCWYDLGVNGNKHLIKCSHCGKIFRDIYSEGTFQENYPTCPRCNNKKVSTNNGWYSIQDKRPPIEEKVQVWFCKDFQQVAVFTEEGYWSVGSDCTIMLPNTHQYWRPLFDEPVFDDSDK